MPPIRKNPVPPTNYTQTLFATLWLAGEQTVQINTHGVRGPGSHICVGAEQVLIYLHDPNAATSYAKAWIDAILLIDRLPDRLYDITPQHTGPALMVRAHGHDQVAHVFDVAQQAVVIRVGNLTWLVRDKAAYSTMRQAWQQVMEMAPIILTRR